MTTLPNCSASASCWMQLSHLHGFVVIFIPKSKLWSWDKLNILLNTELHHQQWWKNRDEMVWVTISTSATHLHHSDPCQSHLKYVNTWHSSMWTHFSAVQRKRDLCRAFICTSDKFLKWSTSDYLEFRGFIIAILRLSGFCIHFFICSSSPPSSHLKIVVLFPALASFLTTFPFTFFPSLISFC